jgi:hypothetical protein
MRRLVVNPGTPQAWEIQLKQGTNLLGRGFANDFRLEDPSVSSSHCQITVNGDSVFIKDLGSTNGTFVDRRPIQETKLEPGQTIHLGGVPLGFYADETVAAPVPVPAIAAVPVMATAAGAPASAPIRPSIRLVSSASSAHPAEPPVPPPVGAQENLAATEFLQAGPRFCKFHPKSPARYLCTKCNRSFCDLCVVSRTSGTTVKKSCRSCGVECQALQVHLTGPVAAKGFFARLPDAFVYPLRGTGVFTILIGVLVLAALKLVVVMMALRTIRTIGFGTILGICAVGYLFTYLQTILHSTAAEDRELPDLPGLGNFLEDVLMPFFRFLGLAVFCFVPAIAISVWFGLTLQPLLVPVLIAAVFFGYLYFPMAFLAVATLDSIAALNPLVVIPSIFKAPLEYLVTLIFLFFASGVRFGGNFALAVAVPEQWSTRSMGELFLLIVGNVVLSFVSMYLLVVNTRVLGLIFVTKREKLGWLHR